MRSPEKIPQEQSLVWPGTVPAPLVPLARAVEQGAAGEALLAWLRATVAHQKEPGCWFYLAWTYLNAGDVDKSVLALERASHGAAALGARAWDALARLLVGAGRHTAALGLVMQADDAGCCDGRLLDLGAALALDVGTASQARDLAQRALNASPNARAPHYHLALALLELGDNVSARAILAAMPPQPKPLDELGARCQLAQVMAALPLVSASTAETAAAIVHYRAALQDWTGAVDLADPAAATAWRGAISARQPFSLGYLTSDVLDLQRRYGQTVAHIAATAPAAASGLSTPAIGGAKLRVGFATAFVRNHSVWKLPLRSWLTDLDRDQLDITVFDLGDQTDAVTTAARALPLHYHGGLRRDAGIVADVIRQAKLDVLIYPEIGMDVLTAQLAAWPLARRQAVGIGHPVTTGLPTIDVMLSSAMMEPPEGASHYTERLVPLPGLGCGYLTPHQGTPLPPTTLPLPPDQPWLLCIQSLYKYQPAYDRDFVELAQAVPKGLLVFLASNNPKVTALFEQRLAAVFAEAMMNWRDHCVLLPRLGGPHFHALLYHGAIFIDSRGWSGFNSVCESLSAGTPVLTVPGDTCRGRHAHGVLQWCGLKHWSYPDWSALCAAASIMVRDGVDPVPVIEVQDRLADGSAAIAGLEAWLME
jgi:predicted O-linked N-acetylglucosamine transferase (SPINDLY family)